MGICWYGQKSKIPAPAAVTEILFEIAEPEEASGIVRASAIGTWVTRRLPLKIYSPGTWNPETRNLERIPLGSP
jgi:hypothetical protein